jgi:hypothetical protein
LIGFFLILLLAKRSLLLHLKKLTTKKILLILMFALVTNIRAKAQTFKLTPEGFVSVADPTKDYAVFEYADKKKGADLYKSSLLCLNAYYVSPKEVLNTVEGESITILGIMKRL